MIFWSWTESCHVCNGDGIVTFAMGTESNVCSDQEMQKVCHVCNSFDRELVKWHGLDFTRDVYFENKVKYKWQQKNITEKDDTKCIIGDYIFANVTSVFCKRDIIYWTESAFGVIKTIKIYKHDPNWALTICHCPVLMIWTRSVMGANRILQNWPLFWPSTSKAVGRNRLLVTFARLLFVVQLKVKKSACYFYVCVLYFQWYLIWGLNLNECWWCLEQNIAFNEIAHAGDGK